MRKDENQIFWLKEEEINRAINDEYRQYFIAKLGRPQLLDNIEAEDLEIGTSLYKQAKADVPHKHKMSPEILYILKGKYAILTLEDMMEYELSAGDFFVIPPRTAYASKAYAGTQTLFVKTGGNDKAEVEISPKVQKWLKDLPNKKE